jgi:hypothetical protein
MTRSTRPRSCQVHGRSRSRQSSGAYGSKQSYYEQLINTLPQELFNNPQGQRAQNYQLSSDSVRAAMSGGDALYSEVQVHLNNLATLSRKSITPPTPRTPQTCKTVLPLKTACCLGSVEAVSVEHEPASEPEQR